MRFTCCVERMSPSARLLDILHERGIDEVVIDHSLLVSLGQLAWEIMKSAKVRRIRSASQVPSASSEEEGLVFLNGGEGAVLDFKDRDILFPS